MKLKREDNVKFRINPIKEILKTNFFWDNFFKLN